MLKATHQYRYEFRFPYPKPRLGAVATGTLQTNRAYSDSEVEALAREMANGVLDDAKLIRVERLN